MRRFIVVIVYIIFSSLTAVGVSAQDAGLSDRLRVECGDVVEGEFLESVETQVYSIDVSAGDKVEARVVPIGETLKTSMYAHGPAGQVIAVSSGSMRSRGAETSPSIITGVLSANGVHVIFVTNYSVPVRSGGVGVYSLLVGCVLRDGTVIEAMPDGGVGNPVNPPPSPVTYGFLGMPSQDFSTGIEIPIVAGQPQIIPVSSDVVLYMYDASAGQTATLTTSRVSGDISAGIVVINKDTNETIFIGGMPYTDSFSASLTFPADGTYVVAVFRLDTPTLTETTGAIQISIE